MARREFATPTWWDRFWNWPSPPQMRRFFEDDEDELRLEEFIEEGQLVVRAELPGIDPDRDVDIEIQDHSLRIRAERRREQRSEESGRFHSEFHYGTFTRVIPLASAATEKDVKASYRDGILEVRVPIDQQVAQARKIAIERG